jgi:hypothetical protein
MGSRHRRVGQQHDNRCKACRHGWGFADAALGVFDGARCYLFACSYLAPVEDYEPIVSSVLGKTQIIDDKYIIEEMALVDLLNQTVGDNI